MGRVLLLYASAYGHTRRIAETIASHLADHAQRVDLVDAFAPHLPAPDGYDAVVLGSRVHKGAHARPLVAWASRHRAALVGRPTAFFSVGLPPAAARPRVRAEARAAIERFMRATGWRPARTATFAGALSLGEVPPLLRLVARSMRPERGGHDGSRLEVDDTDWAAVRRFAHEIAGDVQATRRPRATPTGEVARGA